MSNLISTPRFWKNKAILVKTETVYGTDATPTGAANWIEGRNVSFQPYDAETAERNIDMPWLGSSGKVVTAKWGKLKFDVLMAGSGAAGTAPKYAPLLLACGTAETLVAATSAAYNLVSSAFGSATMWINIDGVYHKLVGGRGELAGKASAKGIPLLSFSFDCCYVAPEAAAMPAVTRTGWQFDEGVNAVNTTALTLNGVQLAFSELDFALGNQLARINLPGPQVEVAITGRSPTMGLTVLAPPLAAFNPFALADAGTNVNVSFTHGSTAGRKAKVDGKVIVSGVEYAEVDGMLAYKLNVDPTPVSGNDELTYTCL